MKPDKHKVGFQLLSPERMREIASMGGKKANELGRGHKWNRQEASIAGRKGGALSKGGGRPKNKLEGA